MSLTAKIEAVIYASEEPVTLQQLVGLLGDEAGAELDGIAAGQGALPLDEDDAGNRQQEIGNSGQAAKELLTEAFATSAGQDGAVPEAELVKSADAVVPAPVVPAPEGVTVSTQEEASEAGADAMPVKAGETVCTDSVEGAESSAAADADRRRTRERERAVREHIRHAVDRLIRDYVESDRGIEIREVASGYRMATKPEYHDAVRGFVKSLKPALKLTLPALETLAVVAYKQPVTAAEVSEIRGVDSAGVLGGLMTRRLITTAGRKQVIGRPMLYKTTRDFLLRFGLKDVNELPSMDEFERMAGELVEQDELPMEHADVLVERANARGDAEHIRDVTGAGALADASKAADAEESDVTVESNEALQVVTAALSSDETGTDATAETAAGGNDDRRNESAAAAPLHTAETSEPAGQQDGKSANGQTAAGAQEEAEWVSGA